MNQQGSLHLQRICKSELALAADQQRRLASARDLQGRFCLCNKSAGGQTGEMQ
jgi:hypothetical protein